MDGVSDVIERLHDLGNSIGSLERLVKEVLNKMSDKEFWEKVCHNVIADTLDEVPAGTYLFQCAWSNREIFDERNNPRHYMIAKDPATPERKREHRPEVQVNIAGVSRFAMICPYEGTQRCPRRNFMFRTEKERECESMVVRDSGHSEEDRKHGYRPNIEGAVFTSEDLSVTHKKRV